jgi:uncharacterized protein (TIGR03067 family)
VLCCFAGRSAAEVAAELGCAVGTVESRLARARQRLRSALARRGFVVPTLLAAGLPSPVRSACPGVLHRLAVAAALLAAFAGAALLPGHHPSPAAEDTKVAPKGDLAKLQGRWRLVTLEPAKFHQKQEVVWAIGGNTIRVLLKGKEMLRCTFTLDEKGTPRQIDLVIPQPNGSKKKVLGIYKVEKDTLTVCEARPDRERPAKFEAAKEGPFPSLAVYRR